MIRKALIASSAEPLDVGQAIAEWRRAMIAGGISSPETLDELESHLRDDAEEKRARGLSAEEAFAAAVQQIGQVAALQSEFKKIEHSNEKTAMKLTVILVGIVVALMGLGMILPALANYGHPHPFSERAIIGLVIAVVLVTTGASAIFYGIKLRKTPKRVE